MDRQSAYKANIGELMLDKKIYLVIYKDGTVFPTTDKPVKEGNKDWARYFECRYDFQIGDLAIWMEKGCPSQMSPKEIEVSK